MVRQRLYFIDALRAFAILMMLQGHFISGLLDPSTIDPNHFVYQLWYYCRGFTAPVFFTITGWVFMFLLLRNGESGWANPRVKKGLKRAVELILWGYALRLSFVYLLSSGKLTKTFMQPDVLHIIGLGLVFLVGSYLILHKLGKINTLVFFLITVAIFSTNTLYTDIVFDRLPYFIAAYLTKANGAVFYILPWLGYVSFGAGIAYIFPTQTKKLRLWSLAFIATGFVLSFHNQLFGQLGDTDFLFVRLGDVLLLFGFFMLLEPLIRQSLWQKIGTKTLSLYIVHYVILYGSFTSIGLYKFYEESLSWEVAVLGALGFLVGVTAMVLLYPKTVKPWVKDIWYRIGKLCRHNL